MCECMRMCLSAGWMEGWTDEWMDRWMGKPTNFSAWLLPTFLSRTPNPVKKKKKCLELSLWLKTTKMQRLIRTSNFLATQVLLKNASEGGQLQYRTKHFQRKLAFPNNIPYTCAPWTKCAHTCSCVSSFHPALPHRPGYPLILLSP